MFRLGEMCLITVMSWQIIIFNDKNKLMDIHIISIIVSSQPTDRNVEMREKKVIMEGIVHRSWYRKHHYSSVHHFITIVKQENRYC
jgi:hypothetical protein